MNKKLLTFGILASLLVTSGVMALVISYFHQVNTDLTVVEARSSVDIPFSLSCFSGETKLSGLSVHNSADVPLKAQLTWTEDTNLGAVNYTTNLPMVLDLAPLADTFANVSMTCDALTPAGSVNGTISYFPYR